MKERKTANINFRLDPKMKTALNKKVKTAKGYDIPSVLRHLLSLYLSDQIVLPYQQSELPFTE